MALSASEMGEKSHQVGGWAPDVAPGLAVQIWSCLRWDCQGLPEVGTEGKDVGLGLEDRWLEGDEAAGGLPGRTAVER